MADPMPDKIGEVLIRLGYVQRTDVERALEIQVSAGGKQLLGEILTGFVLKEEQLDHALHLQKSGYQIDATLAIVSRILRHRLHGADIKQMLAALAKDSSRDGHDAFVDKMAQILEKTAAFFEISSRLADSMSLDTILHRVVEIANDTLGTDRGTVFLNDRETGELYSRIAQGNLSREIRLPNHMGIAGAVFTSGQPILIPDAYADPRFNQEIDRKTGYRTRNILCAPIRTRGNEIIGVIQLLNRKDGEFGNDDLALLEAITSQASSSLLNVQLFEQVQRARREESQLLEVTTAISTELNLEPLLFKIMQATTGILDADRSTLFMHDPERDELWSLVAQGAGSTRFRFPSTAGIAGSVFTTGKTVNIVDAYEDARFNPEFDRKSGYRTRSILCMPVTSKDGERIGVIQVLNKRGGPFTPFDEKRLRAFAAQASVAIANAKLFEQVLDMKNYNESILESLSNGVVTLDRAGRAVKANRAAERILRGEPGSFRGRTAAGIFGEANAWVGAALAKAEGTGAPEHVLDADCRLSERDRVALNLTAVPLSSAKGERIGSMVVFEDITREKRLKGTMARYMAKEVAERLLEEGEEALGGQVRPATIFFSDIRKFTTLSERLGAAKTVNMLNIYFGRMVDIIFQYQGILDKYIGDAIMAVFGAPFATGRDEDNAVAAAVGMMRALADLNGSFEEPLEIGIGISTDEVLVGNIGSEKRMDYTVIGDGVNLASRLEGANKHFGTNILISEFTRERLRDAYRLREVDRIRVKGKTRPVGVFEVLDHHDASSFPGLDRTLDDFAVALERYRAREFAAAAALFAACRARNPRDRVAEIYIGRCAAFEQTPPPPDWDGAHTMTEK